MCFQHRDDVEIKGNWFIEGYSFPAVAVVACRNTPENNNWCKSRSEIENFLKDNPFFFIHQHTHV